MLQLPGIEPRTPGFCPATYLATINRPPAPTILFIYCKGGTEMPQFHTWQPLSMCHQNFETISASEISNSFYSNMRQEFCATMMITTPILMRRLFFFSGHEE